MNPFFDNSLMRNKRFTHLLLIVAAATATPFAHADLVGFESAPTWTVADQPGQWALLVAANQPAVESLPSSMRILSAAPSSAFRLNAAGQTFSSALPDIGLWKFISTVRAQQSGSTLVLLESNLRILESSSTTAPIPLPAAGWFMVMGLLTLLGLKAKGRRALVQAPCTPPRAAVSA